MTYVLAGSLGAVGMVPGMDDRDIESDESIGAVEEINPSDAEALGEHMVKAFEQARATVQ